MTKHRHTMTIADFIKENMEMLKTIEANNIHSKDITMVSMYSEARRLIDDGMKVGFVAAKLAGKYKISVRQFYYVLGKMERELI